MEKVIGRVHSTESFGTVDGPGIRFVVFTQGCNLRCIYCHNSDMFDMNKGKKFTPNQIMKLVLKEKEYLHVNSGGVTATGGEPTLQPKFVHGLFKLCRKHRIHTALDTCLFTTKTVLKKLAPVTSLVMASIKHIDDKKHKYLTGRPNLDPEIIRKNFRYVSNVLKKHMWIRYVVIPGVNDADKDMKKMADFIATLKSVQLVELLPYHKLGVYKWKELHGHYALPRAKPPTVKRMKEVQKIMESRGLRAIFNA